MSYLLYLACVADTKITRKKKVQRKVWQGLYESFCLHHDLPLPTFFLLLPCIVLAIHKTSHFIFVPFCRGQHFALHVRWVCGCIAVRLHIMVWSLPLSAGRYTSETKTRFFALNVVVSCLLRCRTKSVSPLVAITALISVLSRRPRARRYCRVLQGLKLARGEE